MKKEIKFQNKSYHYFFLTLQNYFLLIDIAKEIARDEEFIKDLLLDLKE